MTIAQRTAFVLCLLPVSALAQVQQEPLGQVAEQDPKVARRWSNVVEVVDRARPAVVSIDSNVPSPVTDFIGRVLVDRDGNVVMQDQGISGTGVVIYDDGYIVTNNHVVANGDQVASRILVRFDQADDEREYEATLINQQPEEDLALIKIEGEHIFPTIPISDAEPLLGETVIAIGNAQGQTHTVSTGIVSGLHRDVTVPGEGGRGLRFRSLIQTDAAINLGNSGGPLLDVNGELVGINTAINVTGQNIGFAIPAARVRWVLTNHLIAPSKARSYLGCDIDERTFEVARVLAGGPADVAGLRAGDKLTSLGGRKLASEQDYGLARVSLQPGVSAEIEFQRGGKGAPTSATIEPWSVVEGVVHERLGARAETVAFGRSFQTLVQLGKVDPQGPAGRIGLQAGDVILAVRRKDRRATKFSDVDTLALLLSRLDHDTSLEVELCRDEDKDGVFFEDGERFRGTLVLR